MPVERPACFRKHGLVCLKYSGAFLTARGGKLWKAGLCLSKSPRRACMFVRTHACTLELQLYADGILLTSQTCDFG